MVAVGQPDIWGTRFNSMVTGFAYEEFKIKGVCRVVSSSNWTEKFYQETATELTGGPQDAIKGVPRLAHFPQVSPAWTLVTSTMMKYAAETQISWEDVKTNQFDTMARVLLKVGRGVANAVDLSIYQGLSGASGINTTASSAAWAVGGATGNPVQDITVALRKIGENGFDISKNAYLLLSYLDYSTLLQYLHAKGAQAMMQAETVASNGSVGKFCGCTVIVSNSVTADEAMVIVGQEAATWYEAAALTSATETIQGVAYNVKCWTIGVLGVNSPKAIATITNTQT